MKGETKDRKKGSKQRKKGT